MQLPQPPDPNDPQPITELLLELRDGRAGVMDRLYPLVYDELRRVAQRAIRGEQSGHTLGTTGLVHEAYFRLADQTRLELRDRAHFFGIAAQMMRRILTDHARRRSAVKHGSGRRPLVLDEVPDPAADGDAGIVAVDEALGELAQENAELARIVELRFFGGLDHDEIAAVLGVSDATVRRRFRIAKAWLYRRLSGRGA